MEFTWFLFLNFTLNIISLKLYSFPCLWIENRSKKTLNSYKKKKIKKCMKMFFTLNRPNKYHFILSGIANLKEIFHLICLCAFKVSFPFYHYANKTRQYRFTLIYFLFPKGKILFHFFLSILSFLSKLTTGSLVMVGVKSLCLFLNSLLSVKLRNDNLIAIESNMVRN